jgi:hypothetical protein
LSSGSKENNRWQRRTSPAYRKETSKPPAKYTGLKFLKYKYIDILVKVNERFLVLIEDKIDFSDQPGQLERYLRTAQEDFEDLKRYLHRLPLSTEAERGRCFEKTSSWFLSFPLREREKGA